MSRSSTLIIGAAGAVGKRLCNALAANGTKVIASDRMETLPPSLKRVAVATVGGVDVRDGAALRSLFQKHADANTIVWNLAAPLSVETAMDPAVAEAVTVGGMENVLAAMAEVGARRICFTDSIGSFGSESPRRNATARWLTENPTQDPGSDYGRQKRGCRELMSEFAASSGGDPRFAVLPGVLHGEPIWGGGTTEYALDALLAAVNGEPFVCPVHPDVMLPMIFADDLMLGLIALQDADESQLREPQHGYCIPGLSFSPNQLFAEIRKHKPDFRYTVELNENMDKFAHLWPDTLNAEISLRDLSYAPRFGLSEMVEAVLSAHEERNAQAASVFKSMGAHEGEGLSRGGLEAYVRRYVRKFRTVRRVRGRERYGHVSRRSDVISGLIDKAMSEITTAGGVEGGSHISFSSFRDWSRRNTIEGMADDYLKQAWKELLPNGGGGGGADEAGMPRERRSISEVYAQLAQMRDTQAQMLATQEQLLTEIKRLNQALEAKR